MILDEITAIDPVAVALQENARRPGSPDRSHARRIAGPLGLTVVEGEFFRDVDDAAKPVETGVALLSDLPVESVTEAALPYRSIIGIGGSPRILQVRLDAGDTPLDIWVTHLPAKDAGVRRDCLDTLLQLAFDRPADGALLLCGDFNSPPDEDGMRSLSGEGGPFLDLWPLLRPDDEGYTMPNPFRERRVDYVLFRAAAGDVAGRHEKRLRPRSIDRIGMRSDDSGLFPSDHCGLRVVLTDDREDEVIGSAMI